MGGVAVMPLGVGSIRCQRLVRQLFQHRVDPADRRLQTLPERVAFARDGIQLLAQQSVGAPQLFVANQQALDALGALSGLLGPLTPAGPAGGGTGRDAVSP